MYDGTWGKKSKFWNLIFQNAIFKKEIIKNFIEAQSNIETTPTFKSDNGNQFSTFKEALKDSKGGDIEVIVEDKVLATISSNTNKNTEGSGHEQK